MKYLAFISYRECDPAAVCDRERPTACIVIMSGTAAAELSSSPTPPWRRAAKADNSKKLAEDWRPSKNAALAAACPKRLPAVLKQKPKVRPSPAPRSAVATDNTKAAPTPSTTIEEERQWRSFFGCGGSAEEGGGRAFQKSSKPSGKMPRTAEIVADRLQSLARSSSGTNNTGGPSRGSARKRGRARVEPARSSNRQRLVGDPQVAHIMRHGRVLVDAANRKHYVTVPKLLWERWVDELATPKKVASVRGEMQRALKGRKLDAL